MLVIKYVALHLKGGNIEKWSYIELEIEHIGKHV